MDNRSKDRVNIPFISRNVCASTGGVVFLIIGLPFFLGEGVMLLEQTLKQTPSTINYYILIGSLLATLLGGFMFMVGLSPRYRFKDDTEEELTDWEIENEMHQANTLSKRKPRKRITFFMSRSVLGILAVFTSILALIGLMLVIGDLPYIRLSIWSFFAITLLLSIGLWYMGLSDRFYFRGDPSFMSDGIRKD
ncbi:hypothetical protein [Microscilla marina]|uniref:Transmembrane protein n=1 Tax=Microscilla marina ATCC 23134 TaxID=313606 RepID=A1ZJA7_MICM2|nr:hypothetical protein [Microscilla marina]EAY29643.1 hypothetical protein M23134_00527 [Microscilla marina ATCC 23134]